MKVIVKIYWMAGKKLKQIKKHRARKISEEILKNRYKIRRKKYLKSEISTLQDC